MYIRCWGSRGQIPVSGNEFNKYGGDTTCLEIRSKRGDLIIVDAGSGIRNLGSRLLEEKRRTVLNLVFTHLHLDHLLGFPFFGPVYHHRYTLTIYGMPFDGMEFSESIHGMMKAPYFPVDLKSLPCRIRYRDMHTRSFKIGTLTIKPIPLNHPNGGVGFRFEEGNRSFVFLTDNELGYDLPGARPFDFYRKFSEKADLLIHDAELDNEEYVRFKSWGHSRYTDAVELAIQAGVKQLGLFHINNKRTDRQVDAMVRESRKIIARRNAAVTCTAIGHTFEIEL